MENKLRVELSTEKTKISHFREDVIQFLGVYLTIPKSGESKVVLRKGSFGHTYSRINHVRMNFLPPVKDMFSKLAAEGFLKNYVPGKRKSLVPNAITKWIFLDHRLIILRYNAVINGYINYYSFVDNYHAFHTIVNFILRHSCAKTLARKFRLGSRAAAFKKFGSALSTKDEFPIKLKMLKSYKRTGEFKINKPNLDPLRVMKWNLENQGNLWDSCWVCGNDEKIQMHHVKHLRKNIDPKQNGFTNLMAKLNRKQIPVCITCHQKIHRGEYNGISLKSLKRAKANKKRGG